MLGYIWLLGVWEIFVWFFDVDVGNVGRFGCDGR